MGAWSPCLDGDLDPMIGEWQVGPACAWGTNGACVLGYPTRGIDSRIAGVPVRLVYGLAS